MSELAIRVDGLGKQYRLGSSGGGRYRYKSLRDSISHAVSAPFRKIASLGPQRPSESVSSKDARTFWALRNVSFEVNRGEVVGIIGRNGAGKSTILKILSRITEPTSGFAEIHGRIGSLLEVGSGFHPELTGRENIYLNGAVLGMKKAEIQRKFDEIVAFAEMEKFLDTPVKRYSSGMYMRLAFSVAAHLEPEVLVVDEVLAVGDAAFQKKCLGKMDGVSRAGRTVLIVSHNMATMRALTQRSLYIKEGSVVADGPTSTVHDAYMSDISNDKPRDEDLSLQRRQSDAHGVKVRFLRAYTLYSSNGGFAQAEDLAFQVTLQSQINLGSLFMGFTITDKAGTPIMTGFTANTLHLEMGQVTQHKLTVMDARLSPGEYLLHLSVAEGDLYSARRVYDLVKPAAEFSIRSEGYDGRPLYQWNSDSYGATVHPAGATSIAATF